MTYAELYDVVNRYAVGQADLTEVCSVATGYVQEQEQQKLMRQAARDNDPFSDADYFESGYCT